MTPGDIERLAASIAARTEREMQESEGRIPPLTQNQAFLGYGRKRVTEWVNQGRVRPIPKGKKGTLYRHSELEHCLSIDRQSRDNVLKIINAND